MRTKITASLLLLVCGSATAAPPASLPEDSLKALDQVESAWESVLLDAQGANMPFDDAIFTELSPILTVPEAVKLPADQQLED